ncbi:MAG: hypothetical protein HFJ43_04350 [Clostridia bacterium]|nr:hypothetical protein [Clostridia bacterium]
MFPNLEAEMARKKLTKLDIQKKIGLSQSTFYCKSNGKSEFTLLEAQEIQSKFFPECTLDYLFERKEKIKCY